MSKPSQAVRFDTASIFARIIEPEDGSFSPQLAEQVLGLDFAPVDRVRYERLSEKANGKALTADEKNELDSFLLANTLLGVMKMKAQRSLTKSAMAVGAV